MKNLTSRDKFFEDSLNEMAKDWPAGSVVKFNVNFSDPVSNELVSIRRRNWESWEPTVAKGNTGGAFYMKIEDSGKVWLSGKIMYLNNVLGIVAPGLTVRMKTKFAARPTDDFEIFEKNKDAIAENLNKSFFLSASDNVYDLEGKKITMDKEGEYRIVSLCFSLSSLFDEPVFVAVPSNIAGSGYGSNSGAVGKEIYLRLSDLGNYGSELGQEQREVIAEWFDKQVNADRKTEIAGKEFKIHYGSVRSQGNQPLKSISVTGFFNEKDAEKFMEDAKKLKISASLDMKYYAPGSYDYERYTLEQLVSLLKNNLGMTDVSIKTLLDIKKGAVAAKKFSL